MLQRNYQRTAGKKFKKITDKMMRFKTSVCILAGYQSQDYRGAQIMRDLKAKYNDVEFFGLGGPEMEAEGLVDNLGDINKFNDKPFYPWKNAHPFHRERCYTPYMVSTRWFNSRVLKEVKPKWQEKIAEHNPDLFIALGNELFMKILYEDAHLWYEEYKEQKPPMVYYDRFVHHQQQQHELYLDHVLYTIPKEPVNWQYYKFPSTFVGSQGIYDAYKFLYQSSPRHANLADENGIWVNLEFNNLLMENLITENRSNFRKVHNIGETVTLMFASPGSDLGEVEKFIKTISGGAKMFVEKYINTQRMSSDNFAIVVSIPDSPDADAIRGRINKENWPCSLVIVDTPEAKYQAMCASDLGVAANGETVSEAAALQLSTLILDKMDNWNTYLMLLYNTFNNDLNIAAHGEIYPELTGQNFPGKVAEIWEEWYRDPKKRYDYIKRFTKLIPKMLPEAEDETQEISQEGLDFKRFGNPHNLIVNRLDHFLEVSKSSRNDEIVGLPKENRHEFVEKINNVIVG